MHFSFRAVNVSLNSTFVPQKCNELLPTTEELNLVFRTAFIKCHSTYL